MNNRRLTEYQIRAYGLYLSMQDRSKGTIEKYLRDTMAFAQWAEEREVTKELAAGWKASLLERGYAPVTINAMLSSVNGLFRFLGWEDCHVRFLCVQRRLFRDSKKELNRMDYQRLLFCAREKGKDRLALMIETICATGIRVSEVKYITVEAARQGKAEISMKGKIRMILLPAKLCRKLLKYAKKEKIASGIIFRTKSGKEIGRRQIWAELKGLCKFAKIEPSKVFPHNLRHLFARIFYKASKDIIKLADVLGHSNVETTRIYLVATGEEHQRQMERLGLVL
ncbi:tyrosine-type recombinase/integrase [Anaerotignum lactatifermentans]|uniref:tyrosine-type recombinase/integrase n=1 Tax=Anaerotignum lactatifermentans TaxID=160404 RepID=UPI002ED3ACEF